MANIIHIENLSKGREFWNLLRKVSVVDLSDTDFSDVDLSVVDLSNVDLSGVDLSDFNLSRTFFSGANLSGANLRDADLSRSDLSGVNLIGAKFSHTNLLGSNLSGANLSGTYLSNSYLIGSNLAGANLFDANLSEVDLSFTNLSGANLSKASFCEANLTSANLSGTNLSEAFLSDANLFGADLSDAYLVDADLSGANLSCADFCGANLTRANLSETNCVRTDFKNATIENANIYGISVWDIQPEGLSQNNLIITDEFISAISVDNIEVAQFIYLMLNNEKLRDIIGTIAKKGVLILGRFTPERKKILDAIRDKLREYDFVPIMFDFEKVDTKDFTETINILAGMSRFVIADITNPKSAPLELQATVPDYKIPFLTIIQKGELPFSMFSDLQKYNWVLPTMTYSSEAALLKGFKKGILDKALEADKRLSDEKKAPQQNMMEIEDFEE